MFIGLLKVSQASDLVALTRIVFVLTVLLIGCASAPSPSATASIPTTIDQGSEVRTRRTPLVRVDSDLTPMAEVGGEIVLEFSVSNVGPRDIRDLTIIVNDAYLAKMAVLETRPSAIRFNEQGGEYFVFGTLPKGTSQNYVIRMSPNDAGDFVADVDVAEWSSPDMAPLPETDGGVAEYAYETLVTSP